MKKVLKYILPYGKFFEKTTIEMPICCRVLSVGTVRGDLCLWVEMNGKSMDVTEKRTFFIVGTGVDLSEFHPATIIYVGTVVMGDYVWHVYEKNDYI